MGARISSSDATTPPPARTASAGPSYGPYEAQTLMAEYEDELGIAMVPFQEVVYVENQSRYLPVDRLCDKDRVLRLSGTELKRRLALGLEIPEWFTFPEIAAELRRTYPPRHLQGFTVLFTGLSGAGKSTLANALVAMLRESGDRRVTLLDGDIVRKHLSSELGFSREHRELNLRRIGFVAAEITRNGGIAVCAPIAPYAASRRELRETIEAVGGSSRCMSRLRSRSARHATASCSMHGRGRVSSRNSLESTILTRCPRTPTSRSTPRTARRTWPRTASS